MFDSLTTWGREITTIGRSLANGGPYKGEIVPVYVSLREKLLAGGKTDTFLKYLVLH